MPKPDLEAPRGECQLGVRLVVQEALEIAPEPLAQLGRLDIAELEPHSRAEGVVQALLEEAQPLLERLRDDPVGAELLRQPGVERVERLVGDRPAQHRVGLGVDRLRADHALEQPGRRAVDETLELGRSERGPAAEVLEHGRVSKLDVAVERVPRTPKAPRPVVRVGERESEVPAGLGVGREPRERPQPLPLGRCGLDRPRELRERPPPRRPQHVLRLERRRDVVPERARLARSAVVGRRLAHQVEPARGARAGRVEEVPVAADGDRAVRGGRRGRAAGRRRGTASCGPAAAASPLRARARTRRRSAACARAAGRAPPPGPARPNGRPRRRHGRARRSRRRCRAARRGPASRRARRAAS